MLSKILFYGKASIDINHSLVILIAIVQSFSLPRLKRIYSNDLLIKLRSLSTQINMHPTTDLSPNHIAR